ALNVAAILDYKAGNFSEARQRFLAARHFMLQAGDPAGAAVHLTNAGWCSLRTREWAAAADALAQGQPVLEQAHDRTSQSLNLAGLAWAARERGDLESARGHALAALIMVEGLRSSTGRLDLRTSLLADRQQLFHLAVDILMRLHAQTGDDRFAAEAFAVSERAHGRFLLEALPQRGAGGPAEPRPSNELARRAERVRQADDACWQRRSSSGAGDKDRQPCEVELRGALEELREGETTAAAGSAVRPVSLAEVQRELLADGSQLLLYDLGTEHSYLWLVSKDAVRTFTLAPAPDLERRAWGLHQALAGSYQRSAWFEADRRSAELADAILGPALPWLTGRRLWIVREGALLYVPFAPLRVPTAESGSRQPLVARCEISYLPSASVGVWMRRLRGSPEPSPLDIVALADPLLDARLKRLPFSADEARTVVAAAPPTRGLALLGAEATKEILTEEKVPAARFLHLATHGFADDRYPELSGLIFSTRDERGRPRNGVLHAYEAAHLHLRSELVVLSACDSGLGASVAGEGLVGLPHAFLRAGAGKVLASLWRVNDPAAPVLMRELYQGLFHHGLSPEAALQRAQLTLLQNPRWREPYYWAGFILIGAG
nr:CHAT domain-containing protein [Acidobacteriota bacterium]